MRHAGHHWRSMDTAPKDRPVWLRVGKYERIAQWGLQPGTQTEDWRFDSEQVNFWIYEGRGRQHKAHPSAWAELRHPCEEDPANLGRPKRSSPIRESVPQTPAPELPL